MKFSLFIHSLPLFLSLNVVIQEFNHKSIIKGLFYDDYVTFYLKDEVLYYKYTYFLMQPFVFLGINDYFLLKLHIFLDIFTFSPNALPDMTDTHQYFSSRALISQTIYPYLSFLEDFPLKALLLPPLIWIISFLGKLIAVLWEFSSHHLS